ncbi:hypothetical protein EHRUM1_00420 [Ehrlichia ruminantium]|uniref:hypothetical protein n=1 Tax=Ehrlichia ruminantium TaxID=779 RepID=UPI0007C118A7|nr:hypothetical protein [Ehrlichia ruminantium]GAT75887.1 hypothetical protein EHRUM1_00420 [Ehrlichia ruminantium]
MYKLIINSENYDFPTSWKNDLKAVCNAEHIVRDKRTSYFTMINFLFLCNLQIDVFLPVQNNINLMLYKYCITVPLNNHSVNCYEHFYIYTLC